MAFDWIEKSIFCITAGVLPCIDIQDEASLLDPKLQSHSCDTYMLVAKSSNLPNIFTLSSIVFRKYAPTPFELLKSRGSERVGTLRGSF